MQTDVELCSQLPRNKYRSCNEYIYRTKDTKAELEVGISLTEKWSLFVLLRHEVDFWIPVRVFPTKLLCSLQLSTLAGTAEGWGQRLNGLVRFQPSRWCASQLCVCFSVFSSTCPSWCQYGVNAVSGPRADMSRVEITLCPKPGTISSPF